MLAIYPQFLLHKVTAHIHDDMEEDFESSKILMKILNIINLLVNTDFSAKFVSGRACSWQNCTITSCQNIGNTGAFVLENF